MRRREFIALLGVVASRPFAARAQQAAKLPTIGFLGANNETFERASTDAFVQRLRELGWIEKIERSPLSIAGQRDVRRVSPRSRPSSSGSRSTSFSLMEHRHPWRQRRQRRSSQSCLPPLVIQLARALLLP